MKNHPSHIIFFDGVCNLCNYSVRFVIKRDKKEIFRFASLQSEVAKEILAGSYPENGTFNTIIYYENGKTYQQSEAVLRIFRNMGFPYKLLYGFIILPEKFRNYIYGIISRNRYKWFGKRDQCMVPTSQLKQKFLD